MFDPDDGGFFRRETRSDFYDRHVAMEGDGVANDNPEGCYHCGSPHHHSSDCRDIELELDYRGDDR